MGVISERPVLRRMAWRMSKAAAGSKPGHAPNCDISGRPSGIGKAPIGRDSERAGYEIRSQYRIHGANGGIPRHRVELSEAGDWAPSSGEAKGDRGRLLRMSIGTTSGPSKRVIENASKPPLAMSRPEKNGVPERTIAETLKMDARGKR